MGTRFRIRNREARFARLGALLPALVLCVVQGPSAREKEVQARWDELAPLVERRDVETVLANGIYVRGRVQKVLPDALEMQVKKTSDKAVIPKGVTRIPRELFAVLTVRWKRALGRALLTPAVVVGGWFSLAVLHIGGDELSGASWGALTAGFATGGYLIGASIDAKRMRIVVAPGAAPPAGVNGTPAVFVNGRSIADVEQVDHAEPQPGR